MPNEPISSPDLLDHQFADIAECVRAGQVVFFLGAGVNFSQRFMVPPTDPNAARSYEEPSDNFLPTGTELARYLKRIYKMEEKYGTRPDDDDLVRIAQCIHNAAELDHLRPELQKALQAVFDRQSAPTKLHELLAQIAASAEKKRKPVFFTTNYDDVLEQTCAQKGEGIDVVVYHSERAGYEGRFWHLTAEDAKGAEDFQDIERAWKAIVPASEYPLPIGQRAIVFKIHGSVARTNPADSSFLITEDDYIDYMIHQSGEPTIPAVLLTHMKFAHFLFIGYGLRDWNLRVFLQRLWENRGRNRKVWAVQKNPSRLEVHAWQTRDVDILDIDSESFADRLSTTLGFR